MRGFAACIPAPVQRDVGGDPEQPGAELGFRLIAIAEAVDAQEDILRQFLRDGPVAHQPIQMVDHLAAVPRKQRLKAGLVPSANLHHQGRIRIEGPLRHHAD